MPRTNAQMRWQRVLGAADILLAALNGPEGSAAFIDARADTRFNPRLGAAGPFTVIEFVDAMSFLVKLGLVQPTGTPSPHAQGLSRGHTGRRLRHN